jgi:uncharacterized protein (DUF58 family)
MPTTRTLTFLSAAVVMYLFANQTQVGWLYVITAMLAGVVLAGWWLGRGTLRGIAGVRRIEQVEMHEGDMVQVVLSLKKPYSGSASQIRLTETCPLAAPDDPIRLMKLFIPSLPLGGGVDFPYAVVVDRRGLHQFAPLSLNSRAPFGFFRHSHTLPVPTRVLVYPQVRSLHQLDLLDRRIAPEVTRQRAGLGNEIIGVRPYRPGDSARHIHWRSVARKGELISKEFALEAQPGLTLVLDLFAHPYPQTDSKHTPFEWAVKAATSIADYARKKGYPLHLLADGEVLPIPSGSVTWTALLQYLARVQPTGSRRLSRVLGSQTTQALIAVVLPWPDSSVIQSLVERKHTHADILAVVLDPSTFPVGGDSSKGFEDELRGSGIDMRLISFDDDWTVQLSERETMRGVSVP